MDWSVFSAVGDGRSTFGEVRERFGSKDLPTVTAAIFDDLDEAIAGATDATVTLVATDPTPENPEAAGWSLGHVVAHVTAGLEEGAASAVTMARGIVLDGRLRYETPWEELDTAARVQGRLAESRRMCLAFLGAWPDEPHLDVQVTLVPRFGAVDAVGRHLLGIMHAAGHLAQMREIRRQANGSNG